MIDYGLSVSLSPCLSFKMTYMPTPTHKHNHVTHFARQVHVQPLDVLSPNKPHHCFLHNVDIKVHEKKSDLLIKAV